MDPTEQYRQMMADANNLIYDAATAALQVISAGSDSPTEPHVKVIEILERCAAELRRALPRENPDQKRRKLQANRLPHTRW